MKILDCIWKSLLCLILAGLAIIVGQVSLALHGTHRNGDNGLLVLATRFLQNADGAANALKQTAQDANKIAKSQESSANILSASSITLINKATDTVGKLGTGADQLAGIASDIRTGTVPQLNSSIESLKKLTDSLRPTAEAATELIQHGTAAIDEAHASIAQVHTLLTDPDLARIAGNLAAMSSSLSTASAHINGAAAHADNALGYIELDLKPTKLPFWRSVLSTALSQAIGIPLHYLPQTVTIIGNQSSPKK